MNAISYENYLDSTVLVADELIRVEFSFTKENR